MPFTFIPQELDGVVLVESRQFGDERGLFFETFKASEFEANGLPSSFAQDNQSRSRPGVIRGLHFQRAPHGQGKLVSVARGAVWDVAVDLRPGSPTFARWLAVELQAGDGRALWIPEGFGHGFCVLGDEDAVLTYKCTREYHAASDGGVAYNEPAFGITWPVTGTPIVSDKDRTLPSLAELGLG